MAPQPFVPLANGAQVEFIGSLFGEIVETRLWFIARFDPIDYTLLQELAVGASSWYNDQILPLLSSDYNFISTLATDWTAFPAPFTYGVIELTPGGSAEPAYSANVSIRVAFNGDNSQTFRDNANFIPAIPLSAVSGNYYTSTIRNALFDAYVSLIDLAGTWNAGNNWRWVVTSRVTDRAYRATQAYARTDHPYFPSPVVSPRRRRLPHP